MLTVDTESRSLIYKDGVESVFMVQIADAHNEYVWTVDTGFEGAVAMLESTDMLVFANASFDAHHLRASGIVDVLDGRWRVHDCQTLARVCIPGRWGYKLEQLGDALLGTDSTVEQRELKEAAKRHGLPWTKEERDYYALWRLEPELMERYGKEDVRLTWDVWHKIWNGAHPDDVEVYKLEIAGVAPILRAAEWEGVLVDQDRLAMLEQTLIGERDELREKLLMAGITEEAIGAEILDEDDPDAEATYGTASSKALLNDLIACGVPLYKTTAKSGKPQTDAEGNVKRDAKTGKVIKNPVQLAVNKDALMEFKEAFPVVDDLMEWRSRCKTLKTYVAALKRADPRVHTSFSQAEARTSRMSSRTPNVQNLPKTAGVRDVLIPAPGNAILVGDYDSIEVRILAHMIADEGLIAKLEAGMDLYSMTASDVYGLPYEDVLKDGPNDKLRSESKVTTLTSMYGGGARLIGVRLGKTTERAADIKRRTLDAIPGYWEFDDAVKSALAKRTFSHVTTLLGRRLAVPREKPYVGLNTVIQGNAAELMKLGMVAAAPELAKLGYRVLLVVHDELVCEGPAELADEAQACMIRCMENCFSLRPALKVSAAWSIDSYGAAKG